MKLLVALFFCFCVSLTVTAQNWPSFRGENAAGVADGKPAPTSWNAEKSENVFWKTSIPGFSHASPIVWGNRVFVITAVSSDPNANFIPKDRGISLSKENSKQTWRIYALDKNSGKILWSQTAYDRVPKVSRHVKSSHANSTPVTDGRYVVALFGSEGLSCYDLNGKLIWQKDVGVLDPGLWDDPNSSWGHSSSPIIYKDLVILQADGHKQSFIAAYNIKNGSEAWRVERGEITSWTTPTINVTPKRTELIVNGGRYIRGYDPLTGKELWRFSDNDTQVKMQAPLVAHGLIYITGGYPAGRPMYAFRPGASGDISLASGQDTNDFIAWKSVKGSPYTPTPIVYGDLFYTCADNGVVSAYEAKTGNLLYQQRLPSSFSASPVAADGKLYFPSEDGDVFVVKAGPKFELLSTNPMGQALMASPAISDGYLFLRTKDFIYAIGAK
jgi:hypothetical protein